MAKSMRCIVFLVLLTIMASGCAMDGIIPPGAEVYRFDQSDPEVDWISVDSAEVFRGVVEGKYAISLMESGYLEWETPEVVYEDVETRITIRDVGIGMDASYGLMCRFQDSQNYYLGGIGRDGTYFVMKVSDGMNILLVGEPDGRFFYSDLIDGTAESYLLKFVCDDDTLTLSVDGKELASVQDDELSSGQVGFFAASYVQLPVDVLFDDFVIIDRSK